MSQQDNLLCALVDLATAAMEEGNTHRDSIKAYMEKNGVALDRDAFDAVLKQATDNHVAGQTPLEKKLELAKDKMGEIIQGLRKTTGSQFVVGLYKAGLLSSLRPFQASAVGNTVSLAAETVSKLPAVLVDRVVSGATGQRSVLVGDAGAAAKRLAKSPGQFGDALKMFFSRHDGQLESGYSPHHLDYKPMQDFVSGTKLGDAVGVDKWGKYADAPFRGASWLANKVSQLIEVADQPARRQAFEAGLVEAAALDGINRAGIDPKDTKALSAHVDSFLRNGSTREAVLDAVLSMADNEPLRDVYLAAKRVEDEAVMANQSSGVEAAQKLSNIPVVGPLFLPFPKIPTNVVARGLEHTPLGMVYGAAKLREAIRLTGEARTTVGAYEEAAAKAAAQKAQRQGTLAIGRSVTGAGLMALGYMLTKEDDSYVTEPTPTTPGGSALLAAEGRQGSSLKIGDRWYSLKEYPQLWAFFTGAMLAKSLRDKSMETGAQETPDAESLGRAEIQGTARAALDLPVLKGVSDATKSIQELDQGRKSGDQLSIVKNLGRGLVPAAVRDVAQSGSDERPYVSGAAEGLQDALGQKLPPAVDALGRPAKRTVGLLGQLRGLSPDYSDRDSDPVVKEARKIGYALLPPSRKKDEPAQAYHDRSVRAGTVFREALAQVIQGSAYSRATLAEKKEIWDKLRTRARQIASREANIHE